MRPALKAVFAYSAGLILASAATLAWAQTPSLVGIWSHRVVSPETGETISVIWDEFDAGGRLHTRFVTKMGTIDLYGAYRVLSGGQMVRAVYNDYEPRQTCTMVCTPNPPPMPIGRPGDSPMRFDGPDVVYFGGDRYTRHR
jgi:hypothetical protein